MIHKKTAVKYANYLAGLAFPPQTTEAWSALIDTIAERCEDANHAQRAIDECLTAERCPTVGDLRRVIWDTRAREVRPDPNCPNCFGAGFRVITKTVRGQVLDGAEPCGCQRVQTRKDADVTNPRSTETTRDAELAQKITVLSGKKAG